MHELELATEKIKWDILGISEMQRIGEGIEERSHYIIGVGFLIKSKFKSQIIGFEGILDWIAAIPINVPEYGKHWTII